MIGTTCLSFWMQVLFSSSLPDVICYHLRKTGYSIEEKERKKLKIAPQVQGFSDAF
jgi:hypothetical protein